MFGFDLRQAQRLAHLILPTPSRRWNQHSAINPLRFTFEEFALEVKFATSVVVGYGRRLFDVLVVMAHDLRSWSLAQTRGVQDRIRGFPWLDSGWR
jgi:hypothetical protein